MFNQALDRPRNKGGRSALSRWTTRKRITMINEPPNNVHKNPKIWNQSFPMTVHGQSGLWDGLGLIALGALSLSFDSNGIFLFISGVFLLLFGLLLVLLAIPQVGKPILVLSDSGFNTPAFGFIPWSAVQGIDKQERTYRGIKFSPLLIFYVPDLISFESQFHAIYRLLNINKIIGLTLRHSDIKPDVILSVARRLWSECTGLEHYWSSYSSYEVNEAYRRIYETIKHEKAQLDSICKAAEDNNELKVKTLLNQAESHEAKLRSDWKIINDDLKKKQRVLSYVTAIIVLLIIVYVTMA